MPWLASIPLIPPTTLLVTGSMMSMLSPAEFVWMIRSFDSCAASDGARRRAQNDPGESRETPAKRLFVRHFRHPSFNDKLLS